MSYVPNELEGRSGRRLLPGHSSWAASPRMLGKHAALGEGPAPASTDSWMMLAADDARLNVPTSCDAWGPLGPRVRQAMREGGFTPPAALNRVVQGSVPQRRPPLGSAVGGGSLCKQSGRSRRAWGALSHLWLAADADMAPSARRRNFWRQTKGDEGQAPRDSSDTIGALHLNGAAAPLGWAAGLPAPPGRRAALQQTHATQQPLRMWPLHPWAPAQPARPSRCVRQAFDCYMQGNRVCCCQCRHCGACPERGGGPGAPRGVLQTGVVRRGMQGRAPGRGVPDRDG